MNRLEQTVPSPGPVAPRLSPVLLTLFAGLMAWTLWESLRHRDDALTDEVEQELLAHEMPLGRALAWLIIGLVLLIASSRVLVWGAVGIARGLGVSELIVGLTLVALGTSLPELAASVAAARHGEPDIAVGNVVGSNMFNLLGVLALPGIIAPGSVDRAVVVRDFPIMVGVTLLLLLMALNERNHIGRKRGVTLIVVFIIYFVALFWNPALPGSPS